MTTSRLDALLVVASGSADRLWFGVLLRVDWERWRLQLDLAGGDYLAAPFNAVSVHALATDAPPRLAQGCVANLPQLTAVMQMREMMMNAVSRGWDCSPELSEKWATGLDAAEQVVVRHGTAWTWPAA